MTMGASVQWYTTETDHPTEFPELPWAIQFTDESFRPMLRGDWDWETGLNYDQIFDFERIRDHGLRAAYGHWSYMKNHSSPEWREKAKNRKLHWVAFIAGKRESRRLMGDVVLQEQHIVDRVEWPDACVTTTWTIDLHYPHPDNTKFFPGREFRTVAKHKRIEPYAIPYRTLYSRNIENLFMGGRNISVTHVALGTIRVMRTGGMMGEVIGMAASVCKRENTTPRGVYQDHLDDLIALMEKGVAEKPNIPEPNLKPPKWIDKAGENVARDAEVSVSSLYKKANYPAANINDGQVSLSDNRLRWVSDDTDPEHYVTLTWEEPVTVNALRLVTGQAGGGKGPTTPISAFVLQCREDGRWKDIEKTKTELNISCDVSLTFPEVTSDAFRLEIINTPGNLARLWEMELYHLPKSVLSKQD
jgi:hypothetical protein